MSELLYKARILADALRRAHVRGIPGALCGDHVSGPTRGRGVIALVGAEDAADTLDALISEVEQLQASHAAAICRDVNPEGTPSINQGRPSLARFRHIMED